MNIKSRFSVWVTKLSMQYLCYEVIYGNLTNRSSSGKIIEISFYHRGKIRPGSYLLVPQRAKGAKECYFSASRNSSKCFENMTGRKELLWISYDFWLLVREKKRSGILILLFTSRQDRWESFFTTHLKMLGRTDRSYEVVYAMSVLCCKKIQM